MLHPSRFEFVANSTGWFRYQGSARAAAGLNSLLLVILSLSFPALGQWTNQVVTLNPGWNAVFLELQPEPTDCDTLFAGTPVESVWFWNQRFSTIQYIQDATELLPGQPDWLFWTREPASVPRSLYHLQGNKAYLVKVATNSPAFSWTVHGRPSMRSTDWLSGSFNLVGLHVDPAAPPTFQAYFAPSAAHKGQPIYRLNGFGGWTLVHADSERPASGRAYWVRCASPSTYSGPLSLSVDKGGSLDYGRTIPEQTLVIQNASSITRTFSVRQVASAPPPNTAYPSLAGDVPLSYWVAGYPTNIGFCPLPNLLTNAIPPGGQWSLRLAVRRPDMAAYTPVPGAPGGLYQSLLEVTDGAGGRGLVPLSALPTDLTGLWIGTASIDHISEGATTNCTPTATEFQFRLIVHNTNGLFHLLQNVLIASPTNYWTTNHDATNYVLYSGAASKNNHLPVVRRYSSAAFGFVEPKPMSGQFGSTSAPVSVNVIIGYDDPLNPFKHLFHPDHDNLDGNDIDGSWAPLPLVDTNVLSAGWATNYNIAGPRTEESFTVVRFLTLQFMANDPKGLASAGTWGDSQVGGQYGEIISGLRKNPIYLTGTFRLHRAVGSGILIH
jgi:hypothetical protein